VHTILERDQYEDLDADERTILRWVLDWIDVTDDRDVWMAILMR
jgi:hypothetical protein